VSVHQAPERVAMIEHDQASILLEAEIDGKQKVMFYSQIVKREISVNYI
jgi:hypothetical protein